FLHAHPFYNSEQQSQRYVRLDRAQAYVPPVSLFFDEKSKEIYEGAICRAWNYYRELSALLIGDARNILYDIWHVSPMSHPRRLQKIERSAEKRAIEIAGRSIFRSFRNGTARRTSRVEVNSSKSERR